MPLPEHYVALPTYFAPGAFAQTRLGFSEIGYDLDLLSETNDFLQHEIGRGLPTAAGDLTVVYRFGEAGPDRPKPDPNIFNANPGELYVPAGSLALGTSVAPSTVTRAQILDQTHGGRHLLQVQLRDGHPPNMRALADSILYPPAEDMRLLAGFAAWGRQLKDAFTPSESATNRNRIANEVAARYAGAIMLVPRQSRSTAIAS